MFSGFHLPTVLVLTATLLVAPTLPLTEDAKHAATDGDTVPPDVTGAETTQGPQPTSSNTAASEPCIELDPKGPSITLNPESCPPNGSPVGGSR